MLVTVETPSNPCRESGTFDPRDDISLDSCRTDWRRIGRRLPGTPESEEMVLSIPALEDVDPPVVNRIGRLYEIEASRRFTGSANPIRVGSKKRCTVGRFNLQMSSDDEHQPTLTRNTGPFPRSGPPPRTPVIQPGLGWIDTQLKRSSQGVLRINP
jgi:hypothetical protein